MRLFLDPIIYNLKFDLFALLQNLMPEAALDVGSCLLKRPKVKKKIIDGMKYRLEFWNTCSLNSSYILCISAPVLTEFI